MICAQCGDEISATSDRAEYERSFPDAAANAADEVRVCDDCYAAFMEWYESLTDDERAEIEAERRRVESM